MKQVLLLAFLLLSAPCCERAMAQGTTIRKPNRQTTTTNNSRRNNGRNSNRHNTHNPQPTTLTVSSATGTINGYDYVDLGLSVKWAAYNVGATSPEGYGNYYAWGETYTKSTYTNENSTTYRKQVPNDIGGNSLYDAARSNWGSSWRLSTNAEFQELKDNCTWTWGKYKGKNGCYVKSKRNGRCIFLPAAGFRDEDDLYDAGSGGYYWSSTAVDDSYEARRLSFNPSGVYLYTNFRFCGRTVRPVSE